MHALVKEALKTAIDTALELAAKEAYVACDYYEHNIDKHSILSLKEDDRLKVH